MRTGFCQQSNLFPQYQTRKLEKERAETIHHEDHGRVPMTISVFASRLYETFHLIPDHILSADTNCLAHVRFLGRFWQLSAFLRLGLVLI
jgi:hypothetical protein